MSMTDKNFKVKNSPGESSEEIMKKVNAFESANGKECRDHDRHQGSGKKLGKK